MPYPSLPLTFLEKPPPPPREPLPPPSYPLISNQIEICSPISPLPLLLPQDHSHGTKTLATTPLCPSSFRWTSSRSGSIRTLPGFLFFVLYMTPARRRARSLPEQQRRHHDRDNQEQSVCEYLSSSPPLQQARLAMQRPDAQQENYQESQEFYLDLSLASTELPDEQVCSQDGYRVEGTDDVGNDHSV